MYHVEPPVKERLLVYAYKDTLGDCETRVGTTKER